MKIIAFYLPQFHNIPENNKWWGDGFTEWINVNKAQPLYKGHDQPKIPLNNNYYNLLDDKVKLWQVKLAKKFGIYGFCYYHYWFNGKLLLEKPMEQMLANKEIDLPFCISWANEPWTKAWVNEERKVLIPQLYGEKKEWKEHFEYLLAFFRDKRYIKVDGKPLFVIYRAGVISQLNDMLDYWNVLAKENGLKGLSFAYQSNDLDREKNCDDSKFDINIEFQPIYAMNDLKAKRLPKLRAFRRQLAKIIEEKTGIDLLRYGKSEFSKIMKMNKVKYDDVWKTILNRMPTSEKNVPGAYARWDNSPRHGTRATIHVEGTPQKFQNYLSMQIKNAKENYHKDMIFMYAWNEWAEGGYLEPDQSSEYQYLEAVKNALIDNSEFPEYKMTDGICNT